MIAAAAEIVLGEFLSEFVGRYDQNGFLQPERKKKKPCLVRVWKKEQLIHVHR